MPAVVSRGCCLAATEKGQQRTWDHIPKRNCMWETTLQKCIFVEMRNTCQVTNQSSHGELSFHHNPHLRLCWGLGLSTSRVVRRGGSRLKNAAHPTYCHCCEFCALKQKPGVLLEKRRYFKKAGVKPRSFDLTSQKSNPNCRPYSSPHQVPKHKMLWYIEKGTLREVGKIDA